METIKSYLEAMFANMPNTPEVIKAKAELLAMMEDKYNELISEGESENAAVGTVISEFGNLDFSSLGGKAKPEEYKAYLHTLKQFYVFVTQNGVSSICIEWINPDQTGEVTNSLISTDKISEFF